MNAVFYSIRYVWKKVVLVKVGKMLSYHLEIGFEPTGAIPILLFLLFKKKKIILKLFAKFQELEP